MAASKDTVRQESLQDRDHLPDPKARRDMASALWSEVGGNRSVVATLQALRNATTEDYYRLTEDR
jgi:hypothetical protein